MCSRQIFLLYYSRHNGHHGHIFLWAQYESEGLFKYNFHGKSQMEFK